MWPQLPVDHPRQHRLWPGWCGCFCCIVLFQQPPQGCYQQFLVCNTWQHGKRMLPLGPIQRAVSNWKHF